MQSHWKTPDFCREFFYWANNTAFYVSRKTIEEINFQKKSVVFKLFWTFVTKSGILGEKISACFTNLHFTCFTCPNEHFEKNFPIEKIFLFKCGGSSSGFEPKILGLLAVNIVSILQTAFFKGRGPIWAPETFESYILISDFFGTLVKNFEVMEKKW